MSTSFFYMQKRAISLKIVDFKANTEKFAETKQFDSTKYKTVN